MSLLARLTVTPLLYSCGALLLIVLGLGVALKLKSGEVSVAEAATATAEADRDAARTERDSWKQHAIDLKAANRGYANVVGVLKQELALAQTEASRVEQAGQKAVEAAQADARDAERALTRMAAQFQTQSRKPACAQALAQMEAACPAFRGY